MLRFLVVLLVLANLFFFAWSQAWLSPVWPPPRQGEREPERVKAQVTPERVWVVPSRESAAPPVVAAAQTDPAAQGAQGVQGVQGAAAAPLASANAPEQCLEAGPFAPTEAAAAAAALVQAGVPATRWTRVVSPGADATWLVYAGRFANLNARSTMVQDWRRLGLAVELMDGPPEWAPGLVLSRHPSRDAAEVALSGLPDNVGQVARVVPTPSTAQPTLLRVVAADAALAARLLALPAPLKGSFKACAVVR